MAIARLTRPVSQRGISGKQQTEPDSALSTQGSAACIGSSSLRFSSPTAEQAANIHPLVIVIPTRKLCFRCPFETLEHRNPYLKKRSFSDTSVHEGASQNVPPVISPATVKKGASYKSQALPVPRAA
ncbi:hypothetical protein PCANC_15521 [Puccinia coronata f. sp. avenae]|uniref:Uncharacterized protein n=1 Tax=Puccinia coronata f. sp. avenae TaxID=200324 RepID=A0A2N5SIQ9_9BASI|nr:hypothetical protein PCANC_15521 [Puccinia coronata f. sp. avenae]